MKLEIEKYKEIASTIIEGLKSLDNQHVINFEQILSIAKSTNKVSDLKSILNDLLDWANNLENNEAKEIDNLLKNKNLPTLSQLLNKQLKSILAIMYRGHINNDNEFYLINNYLSGDQDKMSANIDITELNKIIMKYEESKVK